MCHPTQRGKRDSGVTEPVTAEGILALDGNEVKLKSLDHVDKLVELYVGREGGDRTAAATAAAR